MAQRLYRTRDGKMIGGVCTGLGEYFDIDPVLIRIVFIILAFQGGVGVLAYVVLWIVVPYRPAPAPEVVIDIDDRGEIAEEVLVEMPPQAPRDSGKRNLYAGIGLVAVGLVLLFNNFIPAIHLDDLWPLILVAIGGSMVYNSYPRGEEEVAS